jgi:RNA-directed DNA polymerase
MIDLSYTILPDQEQIAQKFGLNYKQLSSLIYPDTNKSYISFSIPKKNGEERLISAPKIKLLRVQQELAKELIDNYKPRKSAHGFITKRSIVSNAQQHTHKKYVFNIDLKNFFGTIHFGRVRNLLMAAPFNYSQNKATILAQVCCHNGCLPQGAPTSPVISNIICWKMDAQLQQLAFENRCTYSRYADDITFSFNVSINKLPHSIVKVNTKEDIVEVGSLLRKIIKENGFEINDMKVRLQGRNQRQEVTGITVNRGVNLKRTYIRQTASMLHAWKKYGAVAAETEYLEKFRLKPPHQWQMGEDPGEFFIRVVKGRINFIQMVKGRNDPVYRKLAYKLTEALGIPNNDFKKSRAELSTFIIENLASNIQGTGFLLEKVGIVTNEHVISGMTQENYALYDTYRCFEETLKKKCPFAFSSEEYDIGILKPVTEWEKITPYKIGDDRYLKTGDEVTVIGFPSYAPGSTPHISKGHITSERLRFEKKIWVINAPINHGCSGGPILNARDEVIGIATYGEKTEDGSTEFNGFIPISTLLEIIKSDEYTVACSKLDEIKSA